MLEIQHFLTLNFFIGEKEGSNSNSNPSTLLHNIQVFVSNREYIKQTEHNNVPVNVTLPKI